MVACPGFEPVAHNGRAELGECILSPLDHRRWTKTTAPVLSENAATKDLIEQAQENFGSFFELVPKLDASVKEKMGGNAGITFDFGDYDEANSKLGAFLIVSPAETERENLTIPVQFQGKRVRFDDAAFKQSSGSSTFDPATIDQAKRMLASAVLGWLRK
jgi:hypothetical protein